MTDSAKGLLQRRLDRTMDLTESLASALDDDHLPLRLGDLRSNAIGDQFWCIVGARESYASAIRAGRWIGFACSLDAASTRSVAAVRAALADGAARAREALGGVVDLDSGRFDLVIDLLEHEAQHHGQFIRYFYAHGIAFPTTFRERYALSE